MLRPIRLFYSVPASAKIRAEFKPHPYFYWHDYETFGLSPAKDRSAQFAGVRTDMDFNPIGAPLMVYCKPMPDYLYGRIGVLITGITPQLSS